MNARKKLENDRKEIEAQVEMAQKIKEDSIKQTKRMQNQLKEFQREVNWLVLKLETTKTHRTVPLFLAIINGLVLTLGS